MTERLPGDPPSPYEIAFGFSRVVKMGSFVLVGGMTSVDEDGAVIGETPYEQTVETWTRSPTSWSEAGSAWVTWSRLGCT